MTDTPSTEKSALTVAQLAELKQTGRDIIFPHHLPEGFSVEKIDVDLSHPEVPSYAILFVSRENRCFVIEMGTEAGGVIVEDTEGHRVEATISIHNPTFGDLPFWNTRDYFGTDTFSGPKDNAAYAVKGEIEKTSFSHDKEALNHCHRRMDEGEFVKIVESVDLL